jgi:hypothetical protein
MVSIPDPRTEQFSPAPAGTIRVVAWRQRTPTWPHPDLDTLHAERAALLHWWAGAYQLEVVDWGFTDGERSREFVELLLDLGQVALTAGLGALAKGFVDRFFEQRKAKAAKAAAAEAGAAAPDGGDGPPESRPLLALNVVNESGGTVIVLAGGADQLDRALARVTDPAWRGSEQVG